MAPAFYILGAIRNGNRTESSPIRSVIIRVIIKSEKRESDKSIVQTELDDTKSYVQLIINIILSENLTKDEKLVKHVSGERRL